MYWLIDENVVTRDSQEANPRNSGSVCVNSVLMVPSQNITVAKKKNQLNIHNCSSFLPLPLASPLLHPNSIWYFSIFSLFQIEPPCHLCLFVKSWSQEERSTFGGGGYLLCVRFHILRNTKINATKSLLSGSSLNPFMVFSRKEDPFRAESLAIYQALGTSLTIQSLVWLPR